MGNGFKTIDYEYITIYGNSHDGVENGKEYKAFLIYNDNVYKFNIKEFENFYAVKLTDEEESR